MTDSPNRGEIFLICLDPTMGAEINITRPALIISNNINNKVSQTVTVLPLTTATEKIYPFEALISSKNTGLHKNSKAKCNQIRTIDKKRLVKQLGEVSSENLKEIENALLIHLGFNYDF